MKICVVIFILLLSLQAFADGETRSFSYFKNTVSLVLKKEVFAAKSTDIQNYKSGIIKNFGAGWSIVEDADNVKSSTIESNESIYYSNVFYTKTGGELIVTPEIFICFEQGVEDAQQIKIIKEAGLQIINSNYSIVDDLYYCKSILNDSDSVLNLSNSLAEREDVVFCEPDYIFTGQSNIIPSDTYFVKCWGLHNTAQNINSSMGIDDVDMDLPQAWDITTGNSGVIVVVIDTGITLDHPDLNVGYAKDFTYERGDGGPNNVSYDMHGTSVAGCIGAKVNNIGTVGGAPGCVLASARAMIGVNSSGQWIGSSLWTVNALQWAVDIGARVTVNSNGYGAPSSSIDAAYSHARAAGVVHFASSGNDGSGNVVFPASLSSVNAVSAVDNRGQRPSFSNFGSEIAFACPGKDVYTTDNLGNFGYPQQIISDPDYSILDGTSVSAPYAASVAALILSVDINLTPDNIEMIMRNSAVDLGTPGRDDYYGYGMPNAFWAVTMANYNSCRPADINQDNIVDIWDFSLISGNLFGKDCDQQGSCQLVDLDCSGEVGLPDVEILLRSWLVSD